MQQAIDLSVENVKNGGGPFGAVIVKDGKVVATGVNRVTANNDPTAHAEVSAIRAACQQVHDFNLKGCTIYTSCEPCPMCLAAIYWAGIDRVYYGCTIADNALIGFRDAQFDEKFGGRETFRDVLIQLDREACLSLFEEYRQLGEAPRY